MGERLVGADALLDEDDRRRKLQEINDILEEEYGIPDREEEREQDPLDSLVRTILSQNTNDANSGRAYANLRERFPTWQDVLAADVTEVAEAIRVGGLSNQKSERIQQMLAWLQEERGELNLDFLCEMEPEAAADMLSQLKGVGTKTIYVVLCFACGKQVFPVDTHILRVSKRLGLVPENASADKTHEMLGEIFPEGKAYPLHVNLIRFGRRICHSRKPECTDCPLFEHCIAWPQFLDPPSYPA